LATRDCGDLVSPKLFTKLGIFLGELGKSYSVRPAGMIKFTGENENKEPVLGLGLSGENWGRLLAGHPIHFKPSELGLPWPGEMGVLAGCSGEALR